MTAGILSWAIFLDYVLAIERLRLDRMLPTTLEEGAAFVLAGFTSMLPFRSSILAWTLPVISSPATC